MKYDMVTCEVDQSNAVEKLLTAGQDGWILAKSFLCVYGPRQT